jgi:hypothetical protein
MAQWLTFASEHGLDVLRRALFLCMSRNKFLPQPADVSKAIKEVMAKKTAEERKTQPIGDCSVCDNQRMVVEHKPDGGRLAHECECLVEWRRAKRMREAQPAHDAKTAAAGA